MDKLWPPRSAVREASLVSVRAGGSHHTRSRFLQNCVCGIVVAVFVVVSCTYCTDAASSCRSDQFPCNITADCIPISFVCDGDDDCGENDTSDEEDCRILNGCHSSQFACRTGNECIPAIHKCNEAGDCADGSDEENCNFTAKDCGSGKFKCSISKICILDRYVCDAFLNCGWNDTSDEDGCKDHSGCHSSQFACLKGNKCIPGSKLCDKSRDCRDGSDEANCSHVNALACSNDQFQCNITKTCIDKRNLCNSQNNCGANDTSDEENCERRPHKVCQPNEFPCNRSSRCYLLRDICDGTSDCGDGDIADEENCERRLCESNQFRCNRSGRCYSLQDICDGTNDCGRGDASDEENCEQHFRRGCPLDHIPCARSKECYSEHDICDGVKNCGEGDASDEQHCDRRNGCPYFEFACRTVSKCVQSLSRCDFNIDCQDGSDEENCYGLNRCHWAAFACRDGRQCIFPYKRCDGRDNCRDGSDEENCFDPNICHWSNFTCHDIGNCIQGHLTCDGINDCSDGSDEENCGIKEAKLVEAVPYYVFLIPSGIVAIIFLVLAILCCKYHQQRHRLSALELKLFKKGDEKQLNEGFAHENAQFMPYNKNYEIKWKDFNISEKDKLGEGAYGVVFKGYLSTSPGNTIAVKTIKPEVDKSVLLALLMELKVMIHLEKHENIVGLIGACTEFLREGRAYILVEYCPMGSLESYLREMAKGSNGGNQPNSGYENTHNGMDPAVCFDCTSNRDLVVCAIQIARGMQHLQNKKVIHGDLATRNVLLYTKGQVKITDFGLSRQLLNYEDYVKKSQAKLPWRWLALETLKSRVFSHKSDLWSYGVTLWEIFSLGLVPYPGMGWTAEFVNYLEQDHRLPKPKYATDEIYNIMVRCWKPDPGCRPDFREIEQLLKALDIFSTYE